VRRLLLLGLRARGVSSRRDGSKIFFANNTLKHLKSLHIKYHCTCPYNLFVIISPRRRRIALLSLGCTRKYTTRARLQVAARQNARRDACRACLEYIARARTYSVVSLRPSNDSACKLQGNAGQWSGRIGELPIVVTCMYDRMVDYW
jgi:hypothetical protein